MGREGVKRKKRTWSLFPKRAAVMANAVVKFLRETYGKATLLEAVKAGGWRSLFDGSLA